MGDKVSPFVPACNGSVHVELSGQSTSSDAGALVLREALDASQVMAWLDSHLIDTRIPERVQHPLVDQLRTVLIQRALGWIDLSDTRTLGHDPLLRLASSSQRGLTPLQQSAASQATLSRLLRTLAGHKNLAAMHESLVRLAGWHLRKPGGKPRERLTLDIDGLPIEVFGHQGGSAFHGHVGARIYSPLIASIAETGDMVGGLLRPGKAGTADGATAWIPHLARRLTATCCRQVRVRFDAGFTGDPTLRALEAEGIEFLGRIKSNPALERLAAPYLKRPRGRPPSYLREWSFDLDYQADSWDAPRRVVLVVQERSDDLFLHHFFIVTNLNKFAVPPQQVLAIYRRRGKAEAHMGELKSVLNVHLSSTDRGASTVQQVMARNQVSLLLSLMAYQMMHSLRCLLEWQTRQGWSLARLREQVLKVAATITVHARRISVRLGLAADRWWPALMKALPRLTAGP